MGIAYIVTKNEGIFDPPHHHVAHGLLHGIDGVDGNSGRLDNYLVLARLGVGRFLHDHRPHLFGRQPCGSIERRHN
jgi:hypothetical protein